MLFAIDSADLLWNWDDNKSTIKGSMAETKTQTLLDEIDKQPHAQIEQSYTELKMWLIIGEAVCAFWVFAIVHGLSWS